MYLVFKKARQSRKIRALRLDTKADAHAHAARIGRGAKIVQVPGPGPVLITSAGRLVAYNVDASKYKKQAAGDAYITSKGLLFP